MGLSGKIRTRMRGFRVSGLQQDQEEDDFAKLDAHRPYSFHDMKSDLVLPNGARFYNDHTHPEYSTPECRTLKDSLAHDRAGSVSCSGRPIAEINNSAAPCNSTKTRISVATVTAVATTTSFHARCLSTTRQRIVAVSGQPPAVGRGRKVGMERRSRGMCPVPSSSRNGPTSWKRNRGGYDAQSPHPQHA